MKLERIAILVDVQNIYYTVKTTFNCHFDYFNFWSLVTKKRDLVDARAYAIDRNDTQQMNFQRILRDIGFQVKLKPYINRADGSSKGDWDVGLTLDAISLAPKIDTLVLASGDGDFSLLIDKLKVDYNVNTEVFGVKSLTAESLIKSSTKFIAIDGDLLKRT